MNTGLRRPGGCVVFDEFGDVAWPLFDQVVLAVCDDVDIDAGPSVVGSQVVSEGRECRPEGSTVGLWT